MLGTVYFESGDSTLTSASVSVLDSIADIVRDELNLMIDVFGYTDNVGSAAVNSTVSMKRAALVKFLLAKMLDENGDRIEAIGMGSKNPCARNDTEAGRQKNRRVEIAVREPDAVLTWFENDVKVQPPFLRPRWLDPSPHYYLYHDYMVTTGKMSRAHIQYPNTSVLKMDEDALVVVKRLDTQKDDVSFIKDIHVQNGSLEAMLNGETSRDDTTAFVTNSERKHNSLDHSTVIDEKLKELIAAYEGDTATTVTEEKPVVALEQDTVVHEIVVDRPAGFGVGVFAGNPAGISMKAWGNTSHAVDMEIGWSFPDEIIYIVGDYVVHFPDLHTHPGWFPYVGVGIQVKIDKNEETTQLNPGLRSGIGIEYIYRKFGIFAEVTPVIELVPRTPVSVAGGIGFRYYFSH